MIEGWKLKEADNLMFTFSQIVFESCENLCQETRGGENKVKKLEVAVSLQHKI